MKLCDNGRRIEPCCEKSKDIQSWNIAVGRKERNGQKLYRFTFKSNLSLLFVPVGGRCPWCSAEIRVCEENKSKGDGIE
jgi:hypothetical protein